MIHGTPSHWKLSPIGDWLPMLINWTQGCIALGNLTGYGTEGVGTKAPDWEHPI